MMFDADAAAPAANVLLRNDRRVQAVSPFRVICHLGKLFHA